MAAAPARIRVRAYNVGFGDCFLLTFHYERFDRHVLIDFGTTSLPKRGGPASLVQVARRIAHDTDGKLHVVIATHRHADHISGFGGQAGEVIATLDPDLVVQPWTEQPDLQPDAVAPRRGAGRGTTRRGAADRGRRTSAAMSAAAVARLQDMHELAGLIEAEGKRMKNVAGAKRLAQQLAFLGAENVQNRAAVEALQRLGRKRVYVHFGRKLPIATLLPGVRVDVLGPPTLRQSEAIRTQAHRDAEEFWHLAASSARARRESTGPLFPDAPVARRIPQEARWLIPQIDRMHAEELLSLVRILDDAMNNTSLILSFEAGGRRLLFPGDAQIETWRYALRDAPNAADIRERIASTDLYKVGHHGSLNATPRQLLWDAFPSARADGGAEPLVTLLSTLSGKHGSETRRTEVPRRTLVSALASGSRLISTSEGTTRDQFWRDVEFDLPAR